MTTRKIYDPKAIINNASRTPVSVHATIDRIMDRVFIATKRSPIAVFYKPQKGTSNLVAVFGATIKTKQLMKDRDFVGMFDQTIPCLVAIDKLQDASMGLY